METKTWYYVEKSEWLRGEWDDEPDKMQWQDKTTGLPCLIVRGPSGALCGYAGVAPGHPWHGVSYNSCVKDGCEESWCDHRPESTIDVHGGLTFSAGCADVSREKWEKFRASVEASRDEAQRFPVGDAARRLREWSDVLDDYAGWVARRSLQGICHVVPGKPDNVWWFGFDCAHSGDYSPSFGRVVPSIRADSYKDLAYVQHEVTKLAQQLAAHDS